ncbi:MAG: Lrp/AsnC family transcriptional regulator [Planctomycetes bacterium]|nr:Lrp/AsnC family transcriptional regulator [Planctomycetota bacterium]
MQPDALDWRIINILRNENLPNSTVAGMLKVSEGTIRSRLARLRKAGVLHVRAMINPDVLEHQQLAAIGINLAQTKFLDIKAQEISRLDKVLSVSITSGRYDLIIELLVDSNKGLVKFLTETLPQVEGISTTETFLMLKNYRKYV